MSDPVGSNQVAHRDISYALDVEQLDLNLYRSRNLTIPFQARGVFGGQVISQALVAATKCVESEFTLHVRVHYTLTIFVVVHADLDIYFPLSCTRTVDACTYTSRACQATPMKKN